MPPRGHYVNSNTREKTGSKEVEKISQITQIKGWNLRVKFSCRKSPIRRTYHMWGQTSMCARRNGGQSHRK